MPVGLFRFATICSVVLLTSLFQNCGGTEELKKFQFKKQQPGDWVDKAKVIEGELLHLTIPASDQFSYSRGGDNLRIENSGHVYRTLSGAEVALTPSQQSEVRAVLAQARVCQFHYESSFFNADEIRCMAIGVTYAAATIDSLGHPLAYELAPSVCETPSVDLCDDSRATADDLIKKIRTAAAL
jgi:hypothetical protein